MGQLLHALAETTRHHPLVQVSQVSHPGHGPTDQSHRPKPRQCGQKIGHGFATPKRGGRDIGTGNGRELELKLKLELELDQNHIGIRLE